MAVPDVLSALRAVLRADADVIAIAPAAQIYAGEMPAAEAAAQPRASIVLSRAGGPADDSYVEIARTRVDIRCYGSTPFEASRLRAEVYELLKHLKRRRVTSASPVITPTLLHGVEIEGGPTPFRDADGDWPAELLTVLVVAAEVAA